jgi:hypothetical protein
MLEMGDVLKTWSLPIFPKPNVEIESKPLPDHRLDYLEYEGPISGNRGSVLCCDRGTYEIQNQSETQFTLQLTGEKLSGKVVLRQVQNAPKRWTVCFTCNLSFG